MCTNKIIPAKGLLRVVEKWFSFAAEELRRNHCKKFYGNKVSKVIKKGIMEESRGDLNFGRWRNHLEVSPTEREEVCMEEGCSLT